VVDGRVVDGLGELPFAELNPDPGDMLAASAADEDASAPDPGTERVHALHDEVDERLGRVRPNGTIVLDTRGVGREVIVAPVGGLSRNLSTWG
jgi:hypothetical protein